MSPRSLRLHVSSANSTPACPAQRGGAVLGLGIFSLKWSEILKLSFGECKSLLKAFPSLTPI